MSARRSPGRSLALAGSMYSMRGSLADLFSDLFSIWGTKNTETAEEWLKKSTLALAEACASASGARQSPGQALCLRRMTPKTSSATPNRPRAPGKGTRAAEAPVSVGAALVSRGRSDTAGIANSAQHNHQRPDATGRRLADGAEFGGGEDTRRLPAENSRSPGADRGPLSVWRCRICRMPRKLLGVAPTRSNSHEPESMR